MINWLYNAWHNRRGKTGSRGQNLNWLSDDLIDANGVKIRLSTNPEVYKSVLSDVDEFLLIKDRQMVEQLIDSAAASGQVRNIVDVGVWQGGSIVLLDQCFEPKRLVGIEYSPERLEALDRYIADHGRNAVRMYYGVNQAERASVSAALDAEFGQEPIDLVIDDASHLYDETKITFETIFNRLRPGGIYVIEDWGWSLVNDTWKTDEYFRDKPGLVNLVVQLVAAVCSVNDYVEEVNVFPNSVFIKRGRAPYSTELFLVDRKVTSRGAPIEPTL